MSTRIMSQNAVNAAILNGLLILRDKGPASHKAGICYNLIMEVRGEPDPATGLFRPDRVKGQAVQGWLNAVFPEWPEYSGNIDYPVPSLPSDHGAEFDEMPDAGGAYDTSADQWGNHEYGRARRRLLQWLIDRMVGEIRGSFDPCSGAACQIGG